MFVNFKESESDFYQFMITEGNKSSRTKTNYFAWLRFLSNDYLIDSSLNIEKIDFIIKSENLKRLNREKYKREKDISDFRSALRKYLSFLNSDIENTKSKILELNIDNIKNDINIPETEKKSIFLSRIGQGVYRNDLIKYWKSASIGDYKRFDLLVASHIKPWKNCSNLERLDFYNGLLLPPNYDKLFDRGYISFTKNGKIRISKFIEDLDINFLGINSETKLVKIDKKHLQYLEYHNEVILMK